MNSLPIPKNIYKSLTGVLVGWSLLLFCTFLGIAIVVEFFTTKTNVMGLLGSFSIIVLIGFLSHRLCTVPNHISRKSIYSGVTLAWIILTALGALPYLFTGTITDIIQAWFESVSGFTTVGSSILAGEYLENMTKGVGFWRASTQFIGGIGVVMLAVMALPMLGASGLELVSAEAPGPAADKFTPKTRTTAFRIVSTYVTLTVMCIIFFLTQGVDLYTAVCHAFTALSTGGFSPHPESFGLWENKPILLLGTSLFMVAGATDMSLFLRIFLRQFRMVFRHGEFRAYVKWIAITCVIVVVANHLTGGANVVQSIFTVVSFLTTTGFGVVSWDDWHPVSLIVLLLVMFAGGMTGSTTGGLKILRCQIALQRLLNEITSLIRQHQVVANRIGPDNARISPTVVSTVMAFHIGYAVIWILSVFGTAAFGLDPFSSIAAVTCSMSTIGVTLGALSDGSWASLPTGALLIHIVDMLAGRLEILPVFVTISILHERLSRNF